MSFFTPYLPFFGMLLKYAFVIACIITIGYVLRWLYQTYIQAHMEPWIKWGNQTALLLGWPLLLIAMFTIGSKFVFSGTCLSAGYQCKYALGVSEMAQQYLTNLVGGEAEIEVKERKN